MESAIGRQEIKWPAFVSTMACRQEPTRAVVCPVVIGAANCIQEAQELVRQSDRW